ncbi:hypothetical protein ACOSQ3_009871 [Xanthoceras sorbifolium]
MRGLKMIFVRALRVEVKEKPPDVPINSKRIRADDGDAVGEIRKPARGSFKMKLLGMASSDNWSGFVSKKDKLKIEEGDISVIED